MAQQDISPIKSKIMNFIKNNGPSLPAHIATETGQSMLFSSAFLAELLSEKKLVISHMKVGSSPVYFIVGQEPLLEKYSVHIKGKPGEAYALLKEKKFLKDSEQLPAIRVALRSIKDFAKPFRFKEEIYWRYLTNGVEEFLLEKNEEVKEAEVVGKKVGEIQKEEVVQEEETEEVVQKQEEEKAEEVVSASSASTPTNVDTPLENLAPTGVTQSEDRDKTEGAPTSAPTGVPTSEDAGEDAGEDEGESGKEKVLDIYDEDVEVLFVEKIRKYLEKEGIVILEETDVKKREFLGRGRIQSDIGELEILIIGRDKKNIIDKDIEKAMEEAVNKKMIILFLSTGEIAKKAKDIYREHKNLIRFVQI